MVDMTGINHCELSSLPMVHADAKTVTNGGPAILILRICAHHGANRTLHSSGQIEHCDNKVHNNSIKAGGRHVVVGQVGCCVPINIIRGLPHTQMEPDAAEELDKLPHAVLAQGGGSL